MYTQVRLLSFDLTGTNEDTMFFFKVSFISSYFLIFLILINTSIDTCDGSDRFHETLKHVQSKSSSEEQIKAVQELATRLLGQKANIFSFNVNFHLGPEGKDTFQVTKVIANQVQISATSGATAAWGLYYYLKHFCNAHIAWEGIQIDLPPVLPDVNITVTSNDRFRYYQNVCTFGYSSAWWNWKQWEKNIDWMALNGINLALAFNAQEAIWKRVYLKFGLSNNDIDTHFGGPAFLPWSRMGNIRGWGGSLTSHWHEYTINLQHLILNRMRNLGIIPVLPAFAGHVPRAFTKRFPSTNMTKAQQWNKFDDEYCCPLTIEPTDPLFLTIGEEFLKQYIQEFGTNHIYNCDTFNEMEPNSGALTYIRDAGKAVYSAMIRADPDAIWLMQGWMFINEFYFWTPPRVEALLTSVPIGKMIVLDLQSEQHPRYELFQSYYGQPYIWCMLHNFGGTLGMFGSASIINQNVLQARKLPNSTMVGVGLTMEGINQNYVIYELMLEMAYRKDSVHLSKWFENYATRRYGAWNEYASTAWILLGKSLYNYQGRRNIRGHYVITRTPSLKIQPWVWYEPKTVFHAWDLLLKARHGRRNCTLFKYDVVDVTRQVLQLKADHVYPQIIDAFQRRNITNLRHHSKTLLDLFDDLESILATHEGFLLGKWLQDAKAIAENDNERNNYEYNAKNQITLWGPKGEIKDYGNKQWSGVMQDYFKPRWAIFLKALELSVVNGTAFNSSKIESFMFRNVERPFTFSNKLYPSEPTGDSIEIACKLNAKWGYSDLHRTRDT